MTSTVRTNYPFESTGNWYCYQPTGYGYEQSPKYLSIFQNREVPPCPPNYCPPQIQTQPWLNNYYYCQPTTTTPYHHQQYQPYYDWTYWPQYYHQQQGRPQQWWWNNLCHHGFRPSNPTELHCLTNPIRILDREGNRCIYLCYDHRGYKPEEINVTLNKTERCITVESTHETKEGKEHHVQRRFYRKFCLPESLRQCDLSKCELRSYLNADGQLTIECTLPRMTPEELTKCWQQPTTPYGGYYNQGGYYCPPCPPTCYTPVNCKLC